MADCVAFAFAAGYGSALQRLVPSIPANSLASFCITEKGGAHPKAIRSRLESSGGDEGSGRIYVLNGRKKYISCAMEADLFLVAASKGLKPGGRNSIRIVKIRPGSPGLDVVRMKDIDLVPEISHGEMILTDLRVSEEDLLPGDGYADYIKPFRTIEDLHVSAAILAYLFNRAVRYGWGRDIKAGILACIESLRNLALQDVNAPALHILLGGVLGQVNQLLSRLQPLWDELDDTVRSAWLRDKRLMTIADKARKMRFEKAWEYWPR